MTTTDQIIDRKIEATDCFDDAPATVEVTASFGEFDGVILGLDLSDRFQSVELTIDQAQDLVAALSEAITYLVAAGS